MPAPGGAGPGFPLVSLYAAVKRRHKQDTASIPCAEDGRTFGKTSLSDKDRVFHLNVRFAAVNFEWLAGDTLNSLFFLTDL
jgi:hypothetical protein